MSDTSTDTQEPQTITTLSAAEVERRPQTGECVGHCAHVSQKDPVWYQCESASYLHITKNVTGSVHWLCLCTDCEAALKADPKAKVLAGLGLLEIGPPMMLKPIAELHLPEDEE